MSITVDTGNVSNISPQTNANSPQAWNHTTGSNVDMIVVCVTIYDTSSTDGIVSSITFDSKALTKAKEYYDSLCDGHVSVWYRANADVASITNGSVSVSFGGTVSDFVAGAIGVQGTVGSFEIDVAATEATGTSGDVVVQWDTVATDTFVCGSMLDDQTDVGKVTSQETEVYLIDVGDVVGVQYAIRSTDGTQNLTWADADGDEDWVAVGVSFKEKAGVTQIDFADTLPLTTTSGDAILNKQIDVNDALPLTTLSSDVVLFRQSNFDDALALTTLTSDVSLSINVNFTNITLGSELITVAADREFSSDTGFWIVHIHTAIAGGEMVWTACDDWNGMSRNSLLTVDVTYRVSFTVTDLTDGTLKVSLGTSDGTVITSDGTYSEDIVANDVDFYLRAWSSPTNAAIDNISIKEVSALDITTLTSSPELSLGAILDFADTLALTSLTSDAKLFLLKNFTDALELTSLTSDVVLFRLTDYADSLDLTTLTSSPKLFRQIDIADILSLTTLTSDAVLSGLTVDFADTLDLTTLTGDAVLFRVSNFIDSLDLTTLTSDAGLLRDFNFSDSLNLTTLTADAVLSLGAIIDFANTLALTTLTSSVKLGLIKDFVDALGLTTQTSDAVLYKLIDYADSLDLTTLSSDAILSIPTVYNFADILNLTTLTSDAELGIFTPSVRRIYESLFENRIYDKPAGMTSISEVQRQAMKTSDGLYFKTSDGLQMYVKISETAILLLNNIYSVPNESRSYDA